MPFGRAVVRAKIKSVLGFHTLHSGRLFWTLIGRSEMGVFLRIASGSAGQLLVYSLLVAS
jgi:hypothetical protein